jgi:glycosyltransferase involved in cell wall biosynthesis
MRVLFIGSNRGGGGTESHFISLARALSDAGHEVIAAVCADEFIHRGLACDARIRLLPVEFRSRRDVRAIRDLIRIMRRERPDWVVGAFKAEYWGIAFAAKAADVPLVLFSHLDQHIRPWMLGRLMRLVRAVIVPSEYLRRRTIERGLPPARVIVLPNPIDVDRFRPDAALRAEVRSSLGLRPDDVLLGYVGRFEPEKGVETLAAALNRAMRDNPRLHALWVGHGRSEASLRDVVANGGSSARHRWVPWLDDVRPAYSAMDLVALPSEGSETFGRVLVEAQAYGLPVLGARNGGIPEAFSNGETGLLLQPGDVDSWSAAIAELARDGARRDRLAGGARDFALRFDSRRIADEFIAVLEEIDPSAVQARPA